MGRLPRDSLRSLFLAALAAATALLCPPAAGAYDDARYLRLADRIVTTLEPTWSDEAGHYTSGSPTLDSRVNAALLLVHATAAEHGHDGASRDDARARRLAEVLTASPPFFTGAAAPWPDPMFHSPGWTGALHGGYSVMDKAIDPKVAEGLAAAWRAREALALPGATADVIAAEISQVARAPFFRFPNVRLNQINWPLEMAAHDAAVAGSGDLLRTEYAFQLRRFLDGVRAPWIAQTGSTTNLSPSYRFHYLPHRPASRATNIDSAEYASITLHFLAFYDAARRAGMPPAAPADAALLRAWVRRALFGYWTHSGLLNWDTGLGLRRWMKGKTWAYAQQGLLAIASLTRFLPDPRHRRWAKAIFDRGLDAYGRMGGAGLPDSNLHGIPGRIVGGADDVMFAARMAANAARAVRMGLGRMEGEEPPPFYAFDADIGRLAVSTPAYSAAVVAVNRGAFPYGGIELSRLHDGGGAPLSGIGGTTPAAFGVVIRDRGGRERLRSQRGLRRDPRRPPLVLTRSPQGPVRRLARLPERPAAGPFERLEAVGRRRGGHWEITTRHRFTAAAVEETWTVRRRGPGYASVVAQLPSWGAGASAAAALADGTPARVTVGGAPLRLEAIRGLRVDGAAGTYRVRLRPGARGTLRAVPTAPEATNPDPGPTLELTFASGASFARARLAVRIVPAAPANGNRPG